MYQLSLSGDIEGSDFGSSINLKMNKTLSEINLPLQHSSPDSFELKPESSPGIGLLVNAIHFVDNVNTQIAYDAVQAFDDTQEVLKNLQNAKQNEESSQVNDSLKTKEEPPSQSYQQSSDFDLHPLSPDEDSSDHQMVTCTDEIFTNAKKLSVGDYYKDSKMEKRIAQKPVVKPAKQSTTSSEKLDKKERNKIAARKLREKRKIEKEAIKKEIISWEKRIKSVEMKLKHLSAQKEKYLILLPTLKLDKITKEKLHNQLNSINAN